MYVLQRQEQIQRINEMVTLRKDNNTLEVYYHDPKTGEMWKSFFPKRYNGHSGPKVLRPEPLPQTLEQQLQSCINSISEADARGLGIEYSMKPEYWSQILDILARNRRSYHRAHFFTFLEHLGILHVRKMLNELELDSTQFGMGEEQLYALQKRARSVKRKKFFFL